MNSELNNYKLNNPDGSDKSQYGERKVSYLNDSARYVKENPVDNQTEFDGVSETASANGYGGSNGDGISANAKSGDNKTSPLSSSTVSAFVSSAGGSIGALAGGVAASVMTAVIVVVAFVSTLTINLSLILASMYSLVFKVELAGVQEEDFATPIVAILESEDGFYQEREINIDTVYITFDDLEPSTEYLVTVKNEEKVFLQKSYFTASEKEEQGFISAWSEAGRVFVFVEMPNFEESGCYTVRAYDKNGETVFIKDGNEPRKDFDFECSEPENLYCTLSVGGSVVAFCEVELEQGDDADVTWNWSEDYESATATFIEEKDGEPVTIQARVEKGYVDPLCEIDGEYVYSATVVINGKEYTNTKVVEDRETALGHDFSGEPIFEWEQDLTGGYKATAIFTCSRNRNHTERVEAEVEESFIETPDGYITICYATVYFNGKEYHEEKTFD